MVCQSDSIGPLDSALKSLHSTSQILLNSYWTQPVRCIVMFWHCLKSNSSCAHITIFPAHVILCSLHSAGDVLGGSSSHTLLQASSNPLSNLCFALVGAKSNSATAGPDWNGNGAHGSAQASDSVSQGMLTSWILYVCIS